MSKQLHVLGAMKSRIVGRGYYETTVTKGQDVFLERNPDNPFDPNAVEIHDTHAAILGHLPRRDAAFVGPLMDAGMIHPFGETLGDDGVAVPVRLTIRATAKGKKLLARTSQDDPDDVVRGFLASVLTSKRYTAETLVSLSGKMEPLATPGATPSIMLLHRLIADRAATLQAEKDAANDATVILARALAGLSPGTALRWERLTVTPLLPSGDLSPFEGMLLSDALASDTVQITEVDDAGHVPQVAAVNSGDRPVLVLAGDLLAGAKQDRVVNVSTLLPPQQRVILPVSCVEQGRWQHRTGRFRTAGKAYTRLRRTLHESGGQHRVWEDVAEAVSHFTRDSETGTVQDGMAAATNHTGAALETLAFPEGAVGFAAFVDGRFSCAEVLPGAVETAALWPTLMESLAFDAAITPPSAGGEDVVLQVQQILHGAARAVGEDRPSPALGRQVAVNGGHPGAALIHQGRLLHLSLFGATA